jgi:hypothetical protein
MKKWTFGLVFSCFGIVNVYSQANAHIQLNVSKGHVTNLWED